VIGTIAVTDFGWYEYLSRRALDEVNFWTPSDRRRFSAPQFSPFFFKLKASHRAIAGFGYFATWSSLPAWLAWECFHEGNGCSSLLELERRIEDIRSRIRYSPPPGPGNIGCILIVQPTFFPKDAWVSQPADWHDRTVSSQRYDLTVGEGRRIWEECLARAQGTYVARSQLPLVDASGARYGSPSVTLPRLGQARSAFTTDCSTSRPRSSVSTSASRRPPTASGASRSDQSF
jgi:putative restriction endonuclease